MSKRHYCESVFAAALFLFGNLPGAVYAAGGVTFGPEFTFTNEQVKIAKKGGPESLRYQMALVDAALKRCSDCELSANMRSLVFSDGFTIDILPDPSVIEVNTSPLTGEYLRKHKARLEAVFEAARDVGLHPDVSTGGGHIHIGLNSGFNQDAKLFRNFLVDTFNHIELGEGILHGSNPNSPHITELGDKSTQAFSRIIAEFDENPTTIEELAKKIKSEVYFKTTYFTGADDPPDKYQAMNLTRITKEAFGEQNKTLELRFIRPQASVESFEKLTDLFERRIQYLKAKDKLVPIEKVSHNLSPEKQLQKFIAYTQETGKSWIEYAGLLSPTYYEHAWNHLGGWKSDQAATFVRAQLGNMHRENAEKFRKFILSKIPASSLSDISAQKSVVVVRKLIDEHAANDGVSQKTGKLSRCLTALRNIFSPYLLIKTK